MSDKLLTEVFTRVIELEELTASLSERVSFLEKAQRSKDVVSEEKTTEASTGASTRRKAIEAMREHFDKHGINYVIDGPNQPMFIIHEDGTQHRFRLWASRNDQPENESFYSWHTIKVDDVASGTYEYFILSVEDEEGIPVFFILTHAEMQAAMREKTPSGGDYWVYITRTSPGIKEFVETRDDNIDFTPYYENWAALEG